MRGSDYSRIRLSFAGSGLRLRGTVREVRTSYERKFPPMIALLLLLQPVQPLSFERLNHYAETRAQSPLKALTAGPLAAVEQPFRFLSVGGVYGSGGRGWKALELVSPDKSKRWAVFTTPILAEDRGEQVFEIEGEKLVRNVPETETFGLDPQSMKVDVRFDIEKKTAIITSTVSVASDPAKMQPFALFRLSPGFTVRSVTVDGTASPFTAAGGTICVPVPESAKKPASRTRYAFTYDGVLNEPPERGSINANEAMLTGTLWWPSLGREPMGYEAKIHTPKNWFAVTNGQTVRTTEIGDELVYEYRSVIPFSIFSLSAGAYKKVTLRKGIRAYWVAAMNMPEAEMTLQNEVNSQVIEFMDTIHPYPFVEWGSLISQRFGFGGLEAYSYATYQRGWLPAVEPHEPAHTFWGGIIPNTYLKSLWNESFADYFENLYYRERGNIDREGVRLAFRSVAAASPVYAAWPADTAGCEVGPFASDIGYSRGGKVLAMLERQVGTDKIKRAMATWLGDHPFGDPGEWSGFEEVLTKQAGPEVKTFFDQWIRRAGYAKFTISGVRRQGNNLMADLKFTGEPYSIPLEVWLDTPAGGELVKVDVEAKSDQTLTIPVTGRVTRATFDPYQRILRSIDNSEYSDTLTRVARRFPIVSQSGKEADAPKLLGGTVQRSANGLPATLVPGVIYYGDPRTMPDLAVALAAIPNGPKVDGNELVWRGQRVNLDKGGFAGLVELQPGQYAVLATGKARLQPVFGEAARAMFDEYGQVVAAESWPSHRGPLSFGIDAGLELVSRR